MRHLISPLLTLLLAACAPQPVMADPPTKAGWQTPNMYIEGHTRPGPNGLQQVSVVR